MPEPDSESWESATGLADNRSYARTYPTEQQKDAWQSEAEEQGLSLSKYIIAKVEEARASETITIPPGQPTDPGELEELENEVEKLRGELRRERQKNAGKRLVGDKEVVKRFVTDEPQELAEILQVLVESGCLNDFIRKPVENTLYFLAQHGEVVYDRRHGGWRQPLQEERGGGRV